MIEVFQKGIEALHNRIRPPPCFLFVFDQMVQYLGISSGISQRFLVSILPISIITIGHIGDIDQNICGYYRANIILGTSKPDVIYQNRVIFETRLLSHN